MIDAESSDLCPKGLAARLRACELLDAVVPPISDEHVPAGGLHGDASGSDERTVLDSKATPTPYEVPGVRELLDAVAVVAVHAAAAVRDEDIPVAVDTNAAWSVELAVPVTWTAPLTDECPGVVELLDAVVAGVSDEDVPPPVHGDPPREIELPVSAATAAPLRQKR